MPVVELNRVELLVLLGRPEDEELEDPAVVLETIEEVLDPVVDAVPLEIVRLPPSVPVMSPIVVVSELAPELVVSLELVVEPKDVPDPVPTVGPARVVPLMCHRALAIGVSDRSRVHATATVVFDISAT